MSKSKIGRPSKMSKLPIVNPSAAGIDLGSKFHVVAIGQENEEVREFGVYTEDLHELANWLIDNEVTTVAMESTGSYWKGLFVILKDYGLEVLLVNGKYTKQPKGRKSDISDSQWIQKLHALGLLEGSFIPDNFTNSIKQIARHRAKLIKNAATYTMKMQKSMRCMNIRLDIVIKDIMGKSGQAIIQAIIKAILDGERDGKKLAQLADYRVKKSKEEIAKALLGDWREEYVFELQQSFELYQYIQDKIKECDTKIEAILEKHILSLEEIDKKKEQNFHPIK